ncbi:hypothetical protein CC85DRAFT_50059 [Cutaneotrichosporon oleaginosum]|uniref:Uncharacterized protein n=1 Tax=Cutaneotrichosporon oleaginosum TaxID=879819 RepID=A0A0J0XR53_9TREE|nr:uncharacterized protein CC85DRAFT_50059 [Cutaneotrichosporon oleaginosum]KLT43552.1 hypothetical protein CC85DRAFT_50059 [Cutaneotrichosporon oleaginosum]TXT05549.1 hypothetical protein COLE_06869 [Cutaneotrichosporon oleaginosum]
MSAPPHTPNTRSPGPTPIAAAYASPASPPSSRDPPSPRDARDALAPAPTPTSPVPAPTTVPAPTPTSPVPTSPGMTPGRTPTSPALSAQALARQPASPGEKHTLPAWLWHTTHTTSYTSDRAGTRRRDVRERRLFGMVVSAHAQEESLDGLEGERRGDGEVQAVQAQTEQVEERRRREETGS